MKERGDIMKLKELFEMVESQNKFAEFMNNNGYKEIEVVKVNGREIDGEFTKAKDLVKEINECFYANVNENAKLVNNKGFIELTFEQEIPNFKVVDGFVQKFIEKENTTISLYVETKQVWE